MENQCCLAVIFFIIMSLITVKLMEGSKVSNNEQEKLLQMSTKILGSIKSADAFIKYLSKNQVDVNPLLRNNDLLVMKIMDFRSNRDEK